MRATLLAACLVAAGVSHQTVQGQEVERFSLSGNKVAVFNLAGEVRVEAGTGSAVVVEVMRGGSDADRLAIRTGDVEDWRSLRVVYPSDQIVYQPLGRFSRSNFRVDRDGTFGGRILHARLDDSGFDLSASLRLGGDDVRVSGRGSGLEAWADLRVLVPAGHTVAVQLGVGKVHINNVNGHVRVDARSGSVDANMVDGSLLVLTGSGRVDVSNARGHVRIDTGSGGVQADHIAGGTLFIDTGSGSIEANSIETRAASMGTGSGGIRVDRITAPELKLDTGSGSIQARAVNAQTLSLDTGSGSILLDLLSDVRNARIDTGSGSVTLGVPAVLGAELEVDTGSGGIHSEVPLQVITQKRSHLRGRLGDGNGRIVIDTGTGGVRLRAN